MKERRFFSILTKIIIVFTFSSFLPKRVLDSSVSRTTLTSHPCHCTCRLLNPLFFYTQETLPAGVRITYRECRGHCHRVGSLYVSLTTVPLRSRSLRVRSSRTETSRPFSTRLSVFVQWSFYKSYPAVLIKSLQWNHIYFTGSSITKGKRN